MNDSLDKRFEQISKLLGDIQEVEANRTNKRVDTRRYWKNVRKKSCGNFGELPSTSTMPNNRRKSIQDIEGENLLGNYYKTKFENHKKKNERLLLLKEKEVGKLKEDLRRVSREKAEVKEEFEMEMLNLKRIQKDCERIRFEKEQLNLKFEKLITSKQNKVKRVVETVKKEMANTHREHEECLKKVKEVYGKKIKRLESNLKKQTSLYEEHVSELKSSLQEAVETLVKKKGEILERNFKEAVAKEREKSKLLKKGFRNERKVFMANEKELRDQLSELSSKMNDINLSVVQKKNTQISQLKRQIQGVERKLRKSESAREREKLISEKNLNMMKIHHSSELSKVQELFKNSERQRKKQNKKKTEEKFTKERMVELETELGSAREKINSLNGVVFNLEVKIQEADAQLQRLVNPLEEKIQQLEEQKKEDQICIDTWKKKFKEVVEKNLRNSEEEKVEEELVDTLMENEADETSWCVVQ